MAHVKTAISLPEPLFVALEAMAAEAHQSRSAFIADAIAAYLRKIEDDQFVARMNAAVDALSKPESAEESRWMESAARATFERMNELDGGWPGQR